MANRLFLHAVNVHQGGGRKLLVAMLDELDDSIPCVCLLDSRLPLHDVVEHAPNVMVRRFSATVWSRLRAELLLLGNVKAGDAVLCFGNLPPLFRLPGRVRVYVQNRYLVDAVSLKGAGWWTQIRLMMERFWLRAFARNSDGFDVQTQSMEYLLQSAFKVRVPVAVRPFTPGGSCLIPPNPRASQTPDERATFLYVASGEPHKNHTRLLEAWVLLAKGNLFPELLLTVDSEKFGNVCDAIKADVAHHGLQVRNLGVVDAAVVTELYARSTALIYPSLLESFGLPLLEAEAAGLPVLAAELDYVRDLIDPVESFDPLSPRSIALAVRRFLRQPLPRSEVSTPKAYLAHLKEEMALK